MPSRGQRSRAARECVLRAFLGEVPVAGHSDEGRDDATPIRAKRGIDCGLDLGGDAAQISQIGLTSIVPLLRAGDLRRDLDRFVEVLASTR